MYLIRVIKNNLIINSITCDTVEQVQARLLMEYHVIRKLAGKPFVEVAGAAARQVKQELDTGRVITWHAPGARIEAAKVEVPKKLPTSFARILTRAKDSVKARMF